MPKEGLTIVIVSWNTRDITDVCLQKLKLAVDKVSRSLNVEVIVVDNASSDGSFEMISQKHRWVKLVNSGSNLGYAKGNNFGVKHSNPRFKYLLLLNNDAYVRPDTLENCLNFFSSNPGCDVLGCGLVFADGRFQPSAGYLPTPASSWTWLWGIDRLPFIKDFLKPVHPNSRKYFEFDRPVGWTMGAFLFMKRTVFAKTRGFDESFFLYMEEVEWCRRVRDLGFAVWYTPRFNITHLDKSHALKIPEKLSQIIRLEILGLVYFLKRYYSGSLFWLLPVIKIGVFARWLAFSLIGNNMRSRAYWQTFRQL